MLKKFILVLLAIFIFFVGGIFLFRDFLIKWGGNTFFLVDLPYSVQLYTVKTHFQPNLNHLQFDVHGMMEGAPLTTHGTVQFLPLRVDLNALQIDHLPLRTFNHKVVLKTGFVFERGVADVHAEGWIKMTQLDLNADAFLSDVKVREVKARLVSLKVPLMNVLMNDGDMRVTMHITGNPLNPHTVWSSNIQNALNPIVKEPVHLMEKAVSPIKKILPKL